MHLLKQVILVALLALRGNRPSTPTGEMIYQVAGIGGSDKSIPLESALRFR